MAVYGKRKLLIRIAAIGVSLVIWGVLDFSSAQVCKVGYCNDAFHMKHRKKFRVKHPVYHHGFLPNVSVMDRWGDSWYPIKTNSLGFKDAVNREVSLKSDAYRLLFIGDSFTEGEGLIYEKGYVGQLQTSLKDKGVEVLNAGVSSYAPAVYYAKVRHLLETVGLEVDNVIVFIDMSDIWDEANWYTLGDDDVVYTRGTKAKHVTRKVFGKGVGNWLKENSLTVTFAYRLRDWIVHQRRLWGWKTNGNPTKPEYFNAELWLNKVSKTRETEWCFEDEDWDSWGKRGVDNALKNMDQLYRFLKQRGVRLTVGIYPWPSNILNGDNPSRHSKVWHKWTERNGVDLIDLFPQFIDNGGAKEMIVTNFIPYDIHWNAKGHALVAETFLEYFKERSESNQGKG